MCLLTMVPNRTAYQSFALALGRLRAGTRAYSMHVAQTLKLARDTGRCAYAAGVPLTHLVEVLSGLVPGTAPDTRTFPAQLVEAATTSYLDAEASRHPRRLPEPPVA